MDNATDSDLCKIQEILNNIKSSEQGFISACREFGKSNDEIVALLMEKFSLSEADATEKVTNN